MPGYIPKAKRSELSRDAGSSMLITAQLMSGELQTQPHTHQWMVGQRKGVYTHTMSQGRMKSYDLQENWWNYSSMVNKISWTLSNKGFFSPMWNQGAEEESENRRAIFRDGRAGDGNGSTFGRSVLYAWIKVTKKMIHASLFLRQLDTV